MILPTCMTLAAHQKVHKSMLSPQEEEFLTVYHLKEVMFIVLKNVVTKTHFVHILFIIVCYLTNVDEIKIKYIYK